jgi:gliding motility-associated-like protein
VARTRPLLNTDTLVDGEGYFATQTNSTGCESSTAVEINVTINDAPTPSLRDSSVDYCIKDGPTINDLSLNISEYDASSDNIIWYDSETGGTVYDSASTLSNITYYATLIDSDSGCESSVRLEVTPDVTACGKLEFPDGFSPNGDGVNDTLDIDFLGILYPNFTMEIYNRYGNMVYKGGVNTPRFDGTSNQSNAVSKGELPVGVYFYIFNFNDGQNPPEQGRIYLSR